MQPQFNRLPVSIVVLINLACNSCLAFGQPSAQESPPSRFPRNHSSSRFSDGLQTVGATAEGGPRRDEADVRRSSFPDRDQPAFRAPLNRHVSAGIPASSPPAPTYSRVVAETAAGPQALPSTDAQAMSVDSPVLTAELVRQRWKDMEQAQDLGAEEKAKLTEQYEKAMAHLDSAAQTAAKVAACKIEAENAPARTIDAKRKLAVALPKPQPQVPADATLAQIEQMLSLAESKLAEARVLVANREAEDKARSDRKASLPQLKADVEQRLESLRKELASGAGDGISAVAVLAHRTELEAKQLALESELALLHAQSLRRDAIVELTPLEDDLALREVRFAEKMVAAWEHIVSERRSYESTRQAQEARRKVAEAHPALRQIAEWNATLAERLPALAAAIKKSSAKRNFYDRQLLALKEDYEGIQEQVKFAGLTSTIGLHLRNRKDQLPDTDALRAEICEIAADVARSRLAKLQLEQEREELVDLNERAQQVLSGLDTSIQQQYSPQYIEQMTRELLQNQQTYLNNLLVAVNTYLKDSGELELSTRKLMTLTDEYAHYIGEHVLWIRSDEVLTKRDFQQAWQAVLALGDGHEWSGAAITFFKSCRRRLGESIVLVTASILLLLLRTRIRSRLAELGAIASKAKGMRFRVTFEALGHSVLVASLWPCLMWLIGWRLADTRDASAFALALAAGLKQSASLYWIVALLRELSRSKGIAEAHFGWRREKLQALRSNIAWLMVIGLPLAFAAATIHAYRGPVSMDSLGRIVFIGGMFVIAVFLQRVLSPHDGMMQVGSRRAIRQCANWFRFAWQFVAAAIPISFALSAIVGYYYTAEHLSVRLQSTSWLVLGLLFANGLLLRSVAIARYKLARKRLRERESPRSRRLTRRRLPQAKRMHGAMRKSTSRRPARKRCNCCAVPCWQLSLSERP